MKWEYFGYRFFNADEPNTFLYRMQTINKLGKDGWELVSIDDGIAYFKRPIQELSSEDIEIIKDQFNQLKAIILSRSRNA